MDKAKSSFNIERGGGVWRCWDGGAEILCVCSGAIKNRWGQGEGVKSGYRTKGVITWLELRDWLHAEIPAPWLNETKINFAIIWQPSQPGSLEYLYCDTGFPGSNFPSNHACRAAQRINQARNSTAGNTLFMRIASQVHVIRPLLLLVLSSSLHVKALEFAAFAVREWKNAT